jgi:Fe-S oxidoreductase
VEILRSISEEAFQLVLHYGGSWSGEHGDGLVRSYKIPEFFGDQIYGAFRKVKEAFDPAGLMNPGKILDSPAPTENLRIHPGYETSFPETYYRFEEEGGFDLAIEMCTGVGQCRKTLTGTMCPSYIATRDEEHSTRGRANALRSAIAGDLGPEGFTDQRVHEVLDLCLECKACKSECPSSVDMAKMKAEFLTHYHARHGVPIGKRLVASTRSAAEFASRIPRLTNFIMKSWPFRIGLELAAGYDRRRSLPEFADVTLSRWYASNAGSNGTDQAAPEIVLFGDTFSNFYEPSVGVAAVRLFQTLGFRVRLADLGCCGRPLISAGLLGKAKAQANELVSRLKVFHPEVPIVVLEPSCYSTLKDDYLDLVDDKEGARAVADRVFTVEELLSQEQIRSRLDQLEWAGPKGILFHGHCQQKALTGSGKSIQILSQVSNVEEVPDGCCGMAGSFGYEKAHYDLSEKIGAHHLLPAVCSSDAETAVVVPGFSCRSQIRHFTGRQALHPAEILYQSLKKNS